VNAVIADIAVNGRQGTWRPKAPFGPVPGVLVRSRLARRSLLEPKRQGEVGAFLFFLGVQRPNRAFRP